MSWFNPLSGVQRIIGIGLAIALLATCAFAWRADTLRAQWKSKAESITVTIREVAGLDKLDVDKASQAVRDLGEARDRAGRERDGAKQALAVQGDSIRRYQEESERLRRLSTEQRAEVARLVGERDRWIGEAQRASTRTERLAAEAEARMCEEAMDALYDAGF